jgi:hypothetical protein
MICGVAALALVGCAGNGAPPPDGAFVDVAVDDAPTSGPDAATAEAATEAPGTASPDADAPSAESGHMPFPYTAEEIRDAMPEGFWWTTRLEFVGRGVQTTRSIVTKATEAEVWFDTYVVNAKGETTGDPRPESATWVELRNHATFPSEFTTVTEGDVQVGERTLTCKVYLVTQERDGVPVRDRFYFANSKPGAPVVYDSYVNEKLAFRMTLVDWGTEADGR